MNTSKTKVLIIGSGPAGLSAAIYAARAALEPVLLHGMQPGGQLTITTDVENYPGFADVVQGPWLMEQMTKQAENVGTKILYEYIEKIDLTKKPFIATANTGNTYEAETVIICTGAESKWLGLPSEKEFQGYGVSGCAMCDGFFFKGKEVLVIGGGNAAMEEALYLSNQVSKVTIVHRRDSFRGEKMLQARVLKHPKISIIWNHVVSEIVGTHNPKSVTGVKIADTKTGNITHVNCDGVFISIGHKPNTDLFKGQLEMDNDGYILTKPNSTKTSIVGVFAAGDVQDKVFRQAVTAAGTGCMAALEAEKLLSEIYSNK
jgi:thioredoxin reductase (NADPH)